MIRLKHILLEDETKKPSEDPDKMLVKSKESGRSYYISKDNFDPSKHEKPQPKKVAKDDDSSVKTKTKSKEKDSAGEKPKGLMAKLKAEKEKTDSTESSTEPPKSKESEIEKKIGSNVFVKDTEHKNVDVKSSQLRPDLKEKLFSYDYGSLFDEYNELQVNGASEEELKGISKKIQTIAIAKFGALSTKENDKNVTDSTRIYHSNALSINKILRMGDKLIDRAELEKQLSDKELPKELRYELEKIKAIYDMDEHFKTDGAILENDITVYRSVDPNVIDDFVDAKQWVDNAFVSTSLNPIIAEDDDNIERQPLLKIHLKRGNPVLFLPCSEDEFCIETELTLPRGCKFIITDYDNVKNAYDVNVEYPNA